MKNRILSMLLLAAALLVAGPAQAKRVIKYGHIAPTAIAKYVQATHAGALAFAEYVNEKTGGEIQVEVFPLGQLGNERSMLEQVQFGSLDMMDCTTAVLSNLVPQVGLLDLFFMFPDIDTAHKVLRDEEFMTIMDDLMPAKGLVPIGYSENEMRDFNSAVRPVKTVADFKDQRVRVMQSPVFLESIRALGGNPVGMPFPEIYTALQQGVIDMQENPIPTSVLVKFYEVAKNVTKSAHSYTGMYKLVSRDVWESLSPEQQQIFRDGARLCEEVAWKQNVFNRNGLEKILKPEYGITIEYLTPEARAEFVQAVQPVHEKFAKIAGTIPNKDKYGKYAGRTYYEMIQDKIAQYR
ncbi:MAG TPA: DctP family TRAP transporter solute-binding subunit [Desulfomicrobiaceae bacterium]|nr:DctP family TRAP transporter solute-binding subunit [Desulfomicrobiaceae bacterium]